MFFRNPSGQDALIIVATNAGLWNAQPSPGEIGTVFQNIIPEHSFSGVRADYNKDGSTDTADYLVSRKTLGTVDDGVDPPEDMSANGTNEGASLNTMIRRIYDIWRMFSGKQAPTMQSATRCAGAPSTLPLCLTAGVW